MSWDVADWTLGNMYGEPMRMDRFNDLVRAWSERGEAVAVYFSFSEFPDEDGPGRGRFYAHEIQSVFEGCLGHYLNSEDFDASDPSTYKLWTISDLETAIGETYPGKVTRNAPITAKWMHWMYEAVKLFVWAQCAFINNDLSTAQKWEGEGVDETAATNDWNANGWETSTASYEIDFSRKESPTLLKMLRTRTKYSIDYTPVGTTLNHDCDLYIYSLVEKYSASWGQFDAQGWTNANEDELRLMETTSLNQGDSSQDQIHGYFPHDESAPNVIGTTSSEYFGLRILPEEYKPFLDYGVTGGFDYQ